MLDINLSNSLLIFTYIIYLSSF